MDTKRCSVCQQEKPLYEFHRQKANPDGYRRVCKKCRSEREGIGYKQPSPPGFRRCTLCHQLLPATAENFGFEKRVADGLQARCRACEKARIQANSDRYNASRRERWQKHSAEINAQRRAKYRENPEKVLKRNRAWNDAHREQVRRHKRDYYHSDETRKESLKQRSRERYYADPERSKQAVADWRTAHPDRVRERTRIDRRRRDARKRELRDDFTLAEWKLCLQYWNSQCAVCKSDIELHIDHWIPLNDERCTGTVAENIVVLCESCNCSKQDRDPVVWLIGKLGEEAALQKLAEIQAYFEFVKNRKSEE